MIGVVIVAAGSGERLGLGVPKCLARVAGIPLFALSAWPFQQCTAVAELILVVPPGAGEECAAMCERLNLTKVTAVTEGGARRQDSVLNGVKALAREVETVLVHDGARPLLPRSALERLIQAAGLHPVACLTQPISDTVHAIKQGNLRPGPNRDELVCAQTPQAFERRLLESALLKASEAVTATDEVSLVRELEGVPAIGVPGASANIKITYPEDLDFYTLQLTARAKQISKGKGI